MVYELYYVYVTSLICFHILLHESNFLVANKPSSYLFFNLIGYIRDSIGDIRDSIGYISNYIGDISICCIYPIILEIYPIHGLNAKQHAISP